METQIGHRLNQNYTNNSTGRNMTNNNSSSYGVWNEFFISAGIPNAVANEYAVTFSQHRIRIDMLKEITKDILLDMGIKAMGDIIAILRHAKHVSTQNELKIGQTTTTNTMISVVRQPQDKSATLNRLHQQAFVQNSSTSHMNNNTKNDDLSSTTGGKIQSRVSLSSGALRAAANNNTSSLVHKRLSSPTPVSIAKRLRPASEADTSSTEKTLTVKYPSKYAIAKAQQRISANNAMMAYDGQSASNIKSRLGAAANSIEKLDSHNKSKGATAVNSLQNSTQPHRPNQKIVVKGRHNDIERFNHKKSKVQQQSNRLKSTVFRRLGEGAR